MPIQEIPRVPETINFPSEEEKILKYWTEIDVFQTCLKQSKGKPRFSFYDGPPFATGLPHYGHILAGTIKDVVTRYAHQQGFHVERRFGWDCHGLPVEYEIDKTFDIKGPDDVMKMGIDKYNAECRKIVMRYADEWERIIGRIGRWIDFKNDYKTLYPTFMESVWWVFKQLYLKGLVYQGNKVMPYSTTCNTPLSNFESGQNYKDVVDPAVTVSLPIIGHKDNAALLVWTTTPWTLPSNLAACVNPSLEYVLFEQISTTKRYIMLETRIETIFPAGDYKIIRKFPGSELKGLRYEPIFPYFAHLKDKAFRVLTDDYVTSESGTGVVHQAPYFGEDDFRVCLNAGVITKDQEPICPVDASGRFVKPVVEFEGLYVKDADKKIIAALKTNGRLVHQTQIKHSYPFCWRSDTPLIYKAVPSWFVRVEHMTEELQKACADTYWVPDFVKDKRFGNWLRDARDWAISRNRYFGTPIPIWASPSGNEFVCVGSIAELEQLTGQKITDLHRESIDHLEIPSKIPGNPPLRRVPEVFDCWFESGSMPYAQKHYPFEFSKEFDDYFPADFIAEGIDQTRGWFYTLLVISTALFGKAPYKNLIANGLVLASDGQKMSKRKKNYPDPLEIVSKYGADALRLYLINSPVVRAENLRFKEEGVRDILKDVFLPWYNAFRFLLQNIESFVQDNNQAFYYTENSVAPENIMDKWILSFTQSLLEYVRKEMQLYHLYNVIPRLTKFIDYLTNWYVRMNRKRLKGEGGFDDCKTALLTLFEVLLNIVKMMAPFSPFLAETMYQYLKKLMKTSADSVHYLMLPQPNHALINKDIERAVARMQSVIELGRVLRDRKTIPIKYPLPEVIIVHQDPQYISDILSLKEYIHLELNVRAINTTTDKSKYGITLRAEPDYKVLGQRLKQELKAVTAAIQALTDVEINEMVKAGFRVVAGQRIEISEVRLIFKAESINTSQYEVNSDNDVLILLDITPDSSMQDEGTAREIINRIQKLRKKAHLVPTDQVSVFYKTTGELDRVAKSYCDFVENTIKATFKPIEQQQNSDLVIIEEVQQLKNCNLQLVLTRFSDIVIPASKWVNIQLVGLESRYCNQSPKALALLEVANKPVSLDNLHSSVFRLFGVEHYNLVKSNGKEVTQEELPNLSGQTIFVIPTNKDVKLPEMSRVPFCKVFNFVAQNTSGTLILENPAGNETLNEKDFKEIINQWIKLA
ncbi:isoleucine--tRNA ligase, cytoplasmic [Tribolium castaneum]|uniref:Isoleucine--tRNA ligase, cytoplasmic n=1 Tax=Tribolium castaneum TaxID=7070 RepID=D6W7S2_TRICA|nr:PREDICTED: isoleucine--tRNA ligase, cytoplasmic [Tribolium castaneum]EFA11240.1 Isoleucine--tRNA ligase, cytoplasmic-like Protein [Tribolium castaneum]|eukprot:XP_973584.1 PREDICTED: isoleucine--tRNA ligase, cytoplasmic [Tribolium castaneum]